MVSGRIWLKDGDFVQLTVNKRRDFEAMLEEKLGRDAVDAFHDIVAEAEADAYAEAEKEYYSCDEEY